MAEIRNLVFDLSMSIGTFSLKILKCNECIEKISNKLIIII